MGMTDIPGHTCSWAGLTGLCRYDALADYWREIFHVRHAYTPYTKCRMYDGALYLALSVRADLTNHFITMPVYNDLYNQARHYQTIANPRKE